MIAERMFMLRFGAERVPKSLSVLGGDDHVITTPIYGALVETADDLILLDTGISGRALLDTATMTTIYGEGMLPTGPDGNPLEIALAAAGFTSSDITLAAVSHLHLDHTGGIPTLTDAGVPVAIQASELQYGRDRVAAENELDVAFYSEDFMDSRVLWRELDGDEKLASGVWAVSTPGHTPGHMSFRVDLPDTGTWLFAADAADLGENLLERIPCGSCSEPGDIGRSHTSLGRLIDDGEALDARVIPGHDSVFWKAVWHPRGGHR